MSYVQVQLGITARKLAVVTASFLAVVSASFLAVSHYPIVCKSGNLKY